MSRKLWTVASFTAAVLSLGVAGTAAAQQFQDPGAGSLDVQNFKPVPSPYGIFSVDGAEGTRHLSLSAGFILNYAKEPLRLVPETGDPIPLVESQLAGDVLAAFGLFDIFELGIGFPIYFINSAEVPTSTEDLSGATVGDLRFRPKLTLLDHNKSVLGLALAVQVGVPTGNADAFTSSGKVSARPELLLDAKLSRLLIAFNLGANLQEQTEFANLNVGSNLSYGLGAQYEIVEQTFLVGGEIFGSTTFDDFFQKEETPMELVVGLKYRTPVGIQAEVGAGTGLVPGYGAPQYRVLGGLRYANWVGDRDGDGIADNDDQCPDDPEDKDQFEDLDGCPDLDNDQDGIKDVEDQCPLDPEDKDGFEDENGCPDPDNDQDGIADVDDKCPNEAGLAELQGCPNKDTDKDGLQDTEDKCPLDPEDKDGFEDSDGCPDLDNDKDVIPDKSDKCPLDPEDIDGFEDENGCPDPDNDQDGILDVNDKCPLVAGSAKWEGCKGKQKVVLVGDEIKILEKVFFDTGKATIKKVSFPLLDEVADVLRSNPGVEVVEVQGHTDDVGNDASNQRLSEARAKSVLDYLVGKGIDAGRLQSKGYGETTPAIPIDGLKGGALKNARDENRRVQFKILKQTQKTKVIEVAPDAE